MGKIAEKSYYDIIISETYTSKGILWTLTTYFTGDGWWITGRLRGGESLRLRLSRLSLERDRLLVRDRFYTA